MNYGELKTLVKSFLEVDETTFNANIGQFVQSAEEDIYRQVQLPALVKTVPLTLTPLNPFLDLPDDFLSPYYLAVTVGGEYQMMLSKDHTFIRETYPNPNLSGVPRFFAVFDDDTFIIGPTPDTDYDTELSYFFYPPSLALNDIDENETWLSINSENAILYGTIIQGYIFLKGDQDVMKQYSEQYDRAVSELKLIAEGRDRKDSYRKSDRRLPV